MLTVKRIHTSYSEWVRSAYEVRLTRNEDLTVKNVEVDLVGVGTVAIDDGVVFVMNDAGSTVAKYDLGGWPKPESRAA